MLRDIADIHPLALEDLLHQRGPHARSKADYYPQHLFVRVLCHTLGSRLSPEGSVDEGTSHDPSGWSSQSGTITNLPRSMSPKPLDEKIGIVDEDADEYFILKEEPDGLYPDVEVGNVPRKSLLVSGLISRARILTFSFPDPKTQKPGLETHVG